jgi:Tfp pilus assembly protein PilV
MNHRKKKPLNPRDLTLFLVVVTILALVALHAQLKRSRADREQVKLRQTQEQSLKERSHENRQAQIEELKAALKATTQPKEPLAQEPKLREFSQF